MVRRTGDYMLARSYLGTKKKFGKVTQIFYELRTFMATDPGKLKCG